jgi:hypothetical protein
LSFRKTSQQFGESRGGVVDSEDFTAGQHRDIEAGFRDINTDERLV